MVYHLVGAVGFARKGELRFRRGGARCGLLQQAHVLLALLRRKRSLLSRGLDCLRDDAARVLW